MLTSQRKQLILENWRRKASPVNCAQPLFSVSEDTIRRDLRELAAEGRLQRVHGGALPASSAIAPLPSVSPSKWMQKTRGTARRAAHFTGAGGDH